LLDPVVAAAFLIDGAFSAYPMLFLVAVKPTYPSLIWGVWILPALVAVSWILLQSALAKRRSKRLSKNTKSST
jgi:hypothetical protein